MPFKFNPTTGKLDLVNSSNVPSYGTAPTGSEGMMYLNTTDDTLNIFYGGIWQVLHTLTPPTPSFLLLTTGDYLLLETGDKMLLN